MDTPNNATYYWIGGIVAVIIIAGIVMAFRGSSNETVEAESSDSSMVSPYGVVTLKLGEVANFRGISIRPTAVTEDSRCAQDVQCIWAGTVKLEVESELDTTGKRTDTINLGTTHTIDTFAVSLLSVNPAPLAGSEITDVEYKFTIQVNQSGDSVEEDVEGFEAKG
jgi:hypothetical protein